MMCRSNNKVYCTVGQTWDSVSFSRSGQKGQEDENPIAVVGASVRLQSPAPAKAPKLYRASNRKLVRANR
jgi:hypothetical protein